MRINALIQGSVVCDRFSFTWNYVLSHKYFAKCRDSTGGVRPPAGLACLS
jgi:hypothetical protein